MKSRLLLFLVFACLPLCGCPSYSVHPLYTNQDAVTEPALEGTWSPDSDDKAEFVFRKSGNHEYSLAICSPDTKYTQNYEVHLVRLGGQMFMDVLFKDQSVDGDELDDPVGVVAEHVIAKLEVSGDDLAYATLEDDAIRKQSASQDTPLDYQEASAGMLVTSPTDALRSYISAHAEDAFSDFEHWKRKTFIQP